MEKWAMSQQVFSKFEIFWEDGVSYISTFIEHLLNIWKHCSMFSWGTISTACITCAEKWYKYIRMLHRIDTKSVNTLSLRQNGWHFTDIISKCIFLNVDIWILINVSLKFVPEDHINSIPALVQIMTSNIGSDNGFEFTDTYIHHSASIN